MHRKHDDHEHDHVTRTFSDENPLHGHAERDQYQQVERRRLSGEALAGESHHHEQRHVVADGLGSLHGKVVRVGAVHAMNFLQAACTVCTRMP